MSFRKRNVIIGTPNPSSPAPAQRQTLAQGVRPSPLDGRLTTSTGTSSLDQLLGGHAGLPLGTSLLIEEAGTTDFGGNLLRYYAAEGLVQGHEVHLLGYGDAWRRELPGLDLSEGKSSRSGKKDTPSDDKMKIAWRYETLGNTQSRNAPREIKLTGSPGASIFCHSFDLTKRLENTAIQGKLTSTPLTPQTPLKRFLQELSTKIKSSPPTSIHRIIIPSLLSPTLYSPTSCRPQEVLQLLHGLRALLRTFPAQVTACVTLPVSLYPRSTGLTRLTELLFDGVLELVPLQNEIHQTQREGKDEKGQGLLRVHSLPVFHEKGGGLEGGWEREDLSFRLSASAGMVITPFSLPPVGETEEEAKAAKERSGEVKKESLEF